MGTIQSAFSIFTSLPELRTIMPCFPNLQGRGINRDILGFCKSKKIFHKTLITWNYETLITWNYELDKTGASAYNKNIVLNTVF